MYVHMSSLKLFQLPVEICTNSISVLVTLNIAVNPEI